MGFKILMEILIKGGNYRKVTEVPFTFGLRKAGESKLGTKTMLNYLKHVYRLMRWEGELDRIIKFTIVGLSGVLVNEGFLWLFVHVFGWDKILANVPATELAVLNNFTWNDLWTFRDLKRKPFWSRIVSFHIAALTGGHRSVGDIHRSRARGDALPRGEPLRNRLILHSALPLQQERDVGGVVRGERDGRWKSAGIQRTDSLFRPGSHGH